MKKPFVPKMLPIDLPNEHIIELLNLEINARVKVQHFNSLMERSVIKEELLIIFSIDESLQSTRLEGTQASYSDVAEAELTGVASDDVQEVLNYLNALKLGEDLLKTLPLCTRVFLRLHEEILNNSRGGNRAPGEYRKIQNFIGPTQKIEDATYIPPEPHLVKELINNLEEYMNDDTLDQFGYLVRAGIIHGQFETIHPFLDGNGRIGRLLIPLYLQNKKYLDNPCLYISYFFEKNRDLYYQKLNDVRVKNDMIGWLKFFLEGIIETAKIAKEKFKKVVELTKKIDNQITDLKVKYDNAKKIMDYFYDEPYSTRKKISEALEMPESTVNGVINGLKSANIIRETTGYSRNQIFVFSEYVEIFLSE